MSSAAMTCSKCGGDVSGAKRLKDSKGRYFCEPCGAALRQRAAEKLGPTMEALGPPVEGMVSLTSGRIGSSGEQSAGAPVQMDDGTFALADDPSRGAPSATVGLDHLQICPDCGHPLGKGSEVCQVCGFNRKTGYHIGKGSVGDRAQSEPGSREPGLQKSHVPKPCKKCEYDMTGTKTGRCPECGTINIRMARGRETERQTLRKMFVTPLIMIAVGVLITVAVHFLMGLIGGRGAGIGAGSAGGVAGGVGSAFTYLVIYIISVPIGFAAYVGCSFAFVGFDEPLGVTLVRLAGVYAVIDAIGAVLGAIPFLGWFAFPIQAFCYIGLLMQVMELDWEDAWLVAAVTYIVHIALGLALFYVYLRYF